MKNAFESMSRYTHTAQERNTSKVMAAFTQMSSLKNVNLNKMLRLEAILTKSWTQSSSVTYIEERTRPSFPLGKLRTFALFELSALLWGTCFWKWKVIYLKCYKGFNQTLSIYPTHPSWISVFWHLINNSKLKCSCKS